MALTTPAAAQSGTLVVSLKAGRLDDALRELSVRSGVGILFSPDVVGNRRSVRVAGRMTLTEALDRLLAGTGLAYRRTGAGTIVIYALAKAEEPEPAIPEILVIGRRTQNQDIRRTENDTRPYERFNARAVEEASSDDVGQFLRTRVSSNTVLAGPSQDPTGQFGDNRSLIDLHGLGATETLVLVDGARMPRTPSLSSLVLQQPDLNGIPLAAVERVEVLTATAGGIYGPGATGGVINVILKRDYRGADLGFTYGLSTRGDAPRRRIDGRIGFTPDHGRTDVMLTFSRTTSDALPLGNRDYAVDARRLLVERDPNGFIATYPSGNAVMVRSLFGDNLSFVPGLGGTALNAFYTFLPLDQAGRQSGLAATLLANAGQIPTELAPDGSGTRRGLTNTTVVNSLLVNLRHRFGDDVQAFVDFVGYENHGSAVVTMNSSLVMLGAAPANPFQQHVVLTVPMPGFDGTGRTNLRTYRLSSGVIVNLPLGWKADASFAIGGVRSHQGVTTYILDSDASAAVGSGQPAAPGEPPPNPFGDWNQFVAATANHKTIYGVSFDSDTRFRNASLRLAGPIYTTAGGPVTLSLLGEHRFEKVREVSLRTIYEDLDFTTKAPGFALSVSSLYGELRAPLLSRDSSIQPLRGLELELAARFDDNRTRLPSTDDERLTAHQTAVAYTAGVKFYPRDNLMLRASIATGTLPPTPEQLRPSTSVYRSAYIVGDPKRGGREVGSEGVFTLLEAGSLNQPSERARSMSVGVVLNPDRGAIPRLSIDYTRIVKTHEIGTNFGGNILYFLANEGLYPGRVTRAPLTEADRAAGFTGGVITQIDARYLDIGRTWSDVIDIRADAALDLHGLGSLRLYGTATWHPNLRRWMAPDRPAIQYVGFANGPLRWRGNAGFTWDRGPLSFAANGQYYAGYRSIDLENNVAPTVIDATELDQPGVHIPGQFYLDLSFAYRIDNPSPIVRRMEFRLGVVNAFDRSPPIATSTPLGYSYYGDPRRRRIEASLVGRF
ncbi:TonB-dependent receptor [Sphingomonas sp.]|uniref:TonB-dependent receptor n=1 Tax=Sphingomonas sp. TaxID=28214 RepID=UPI001AFE9770|nr:TonB-dependent receptor [Sphingomonas sp.]MBO9711643.1 TonB-dependent receptor [Sphingomonas sp.]